MTTWKERAERREDFEREHRKPQTGPLPGTTQIAQAERMTDDAKNLRDALLMLDINEEYCYSKAMQLQELKFNFGYSDEEAEAVYQEWLKVKA